MSYSIIWPMIALVALTGLIWVLMYVRRISEIRKFGIDPQTLANRDTAAGVLKNVSAADNFRNLLETPILFYVVCLILLITDEVTLFQLFVAWLYVALRILHSLIHVTYNKVTHRFSVYVISTVCIFVMWSTFAFSAFSNETA